MTFFRSLGNEAFETSFSQGQLYVKAVPISSPSLQSSENLSKFCTQENLEEQELTSQVLKLFWNRLLPNHLAVE